MVRPERCYCLNDLRQIGVEGIVTALHHIPNGDIWPVGEIRKRKAIIASAGLRWSVVESLPVSEEIKLASPASARHLENYRISLKNLAAEGIRTVCYNFMPVIDWIRTDLYRENPDGTRSLYFDYARFAYFDRYILQRKNATDDYPAPILERTETIHSTIKEEEKEELIHNIIVKTQGFVSGNISEKDKEPVALFRKMLSRYEGMHQEDLRDHFRRFMETVAPVAAENNVNLCIHPDDPPFPVLGLPRIVTGREDVDWLLKAVDVFQNGLTFCAGSLSSGIHNVRNWQSCPRLFCTFAEHRVFQNRDLWAAIFGRGPPGEVIRIFLEEQKRRLREGWIRGVFPCVRTTDPSCCPI